MENLENKGNQQSSVPEMQEMFLMIHERFARELPAPIYEDLSKQEFWVEMPDGIKLYSQVTMPMTQELKQWPVIFIRNPYTGNNMLYTTIINDILAKQGYAVAYMHVRGALKSEGEWLPFFNEREDGRAFIDWIAKQPWCDGNIAGFGGSYLGMTQWSVADYSHPALKTLYIAVYGTRPYESFYRRGMFRQDIWTGWAADMMGDNRYQILPNEQARALHNQAFSVKPAIRLGQELIGVPCTWYEDWVTNTREDDPYWSSGFWKELEESVKDIKIPILFQGGWFDVFLRSQLNSYRRLPEDVRKKSRFIIGPWHHAGLTGGPLSYPDENRAGLFQVKSALEWFDYQLKGKEYPYELGVIDSYCIGGNCWTTNYDFNQDRYQTWYLSGDAKTQGRLIVEIPESETQINYTYDPANPTESCGGTLLGNNRNPAAMPECSTYQPEIGYRADVISFLSEPVEKDIHIAGKIKADLFVRSSAPATAFTVKVMEVFSDGRSVNIIDDITDIRWRDEERISDYTPGEVAELSLETLDINWLVKTGSRLRVDISSSNYPAYHVHPNHDGIWSADSHTTVAEQTIYCGSEHPSKIMLPIGPAELSH